MDVTVRGRNVELSDGLRTAAHEKLSRLARHDDGWETAEVHFFEERNPRISDKEVCEVTLRGHGHIIRAKAASPDSLASMDRVVDKLEHQMAKLKTRLLSRAHPRRRDAPFGAPAEPGVPDGVGADEPEDTADGDGMRIVKTKQFDIKPMTPEEAALQMEMLGHGFFLFTNADTGVAAVVYRRNDGDVGLIDAQ
ncbi:MAG: ribosome hibernation-promoting factor, HPF/YfiA family [Acidimicrobiales bacterium]